MSTTLRGRLASLATSLLIALLAQATAHAGQVRVSVGLGGQFMVPYAVNINLGDHVTWVWANTGHTVTSWVFPDDSLNFSFDGSIFDSDAGGLHSGQASSTRFSWKSSFLGVATYVCAPHTNNMSGRIFIHDPNTDAVPVADFRISEVQYNVAGGADLIEITNYGAADGNLGGFRIAGSGAPTAELTGPGANNILVPSGGRVVVHLNTAGTNTNTDIFIASYVAGTGLANTSGSLALYAPHSLAPGNALTNAGMILDFVQWGAGAQANETTAMTASFWGSGTFVPTVAAGHSIEYCANAPLDHGVSRWAEVAVPNFGSDGQCLTPTRTETWGRLKTHYRP